MRMKVSRQLLMYFFLITLSVNISFGQDGDSIRRSKRLKPFVIASSATYAVTLIGLDRLWYADFERESFHFFNDNSEWKQLDKLGHFYSAFHLSKFGHRAFQWTGLEERKALFWGTMVSVITLTPIEILDGFSSEYGASYGDIIANTSGALLFLGQHKLWGEIRIHPKYSFNRSDFAAQRPELLGSNLLEELIKDYNAQQYWLSIDLSKFNSNIPKWLNVGIGYSATGMISANDQQNESLGLNPRRQYFIGIDFDLNEYKSRSKFVNSLIYIVNMIHLPAPALELSDSKLKFNFLNY